MTVGMAMNINAASALMPVSAISSYSLIQLSEKWAWRRQKRQAFHRRGFSFWIE